MRYPFFFIFIIGAFTCFGKEKQQVFGIYFENNFRNDRTSVSINGELVAKNIELRPTMMSPKTLIITQTASNLVVQPYYLEKQILRPATIKNSILNLAISINNIWRNFSFDLRKGKFLFVDYSSIRVGWRILTVAKTFQSKNGPLYI
jgi:hypothetical protein